MLHSDTGLQKTADVVCAVSYATPSLSTSCRMIRLTFNSRTITSTASSTSARTGKLKSAFLDFRVKQIRGAEGQVDCLARALFSLLKYDKQAADIENDGYEPSDIFSLIDTFHQVSLDNAGEAEEASEFANGKKMADPSDFVYSVINVKPLNCLLRKM